MSQSLLDAKLYFSQDVKLNRAVHRQQARTPHVDGAASLAWRIEWRPLVGRTLIAARDLPANALIFRERPLVVAPSARGVPYCLRGATPQVALALLNLPPDSPAHLLCTPPLQREVAAALAAASERVGSGSEEAARRLNLERRRSRASSLDDWVHDVMEALRELEHKEAQLEQYTQLLQQQQDTANSHLKPPLPPTPARTRSDFTIPEVRWALGVAYRNAHGASKCVSHRANWGSLAKLLCR